MEPRRKRVRRRMPAATAVAAMLALSACSGGSDADGSGQVFVTGSSTVEPISIRVAEKITDASGVSVVVEGPGTGDGFKKFCAGEADVTGASRTIKDEEIAICEDNGIEFVELPVAVDGLTVATSPENDDVSCLDVPALYALLGPESEGTKRWSDVLDLAYELGSTRVDDLPDETLYISGPGEESGTYDAFVEFAIKDLAEERGTDEWTRADYVSSGNDNLIVQSIEGSQHSLGWIGYAFYKADIEKMKAIEIVGASGDCVAPTDQSLVDGSYPFSRPLYIYVAADAARTRPEVREFIDFYLSDAGMEAVSEVGYVSEPIERLEEARRVWAAAMARS